MKKLTSSSGVVLYEEGPRLYIAKAPASWTSTFLFVNGLLVLILLVNGLIQIFMMGEEADSSRIGMVLTGLGVLLLLLFLKVRNYRKKKANMPVEELELIAIFDLADNKLLDGREQILKSLSEVRLMRKMQVSSSSPELLVQWSGGSLSLVKGNPFSGGIDSIENVLITKGIRKG